MTDDRNTENADAMRRLASVVRTLKAGAGSTGALAIDFNQLAHDVECVLAIASCGGSHASSDFQSRVAPWLGVCFTPDIAASPTERNHRFLEEALELVQSTGCTRSEAHQLVDYVFGRAVGEPRQEVGGVMVTLAALCLAHGFDMHEDGEAELARIWTKVDRIRAKQEAKPKISPIPPGPEGAPHRIREAAKAMWALDQDETTFEEAEAANDNAFRWIMSQATAAVEAMDRHRA